MLTVGLIGYGAIGRYVAAALPEIGARLDCVISRSGEADADAPVFTTFDAQRPDVMVDCAGHGGLRQHGAAVLRAGVPLITVSLGALADASLFDVLRAAAESGGSRLHLCSGAIGGLDALSAARCGQLHSVRYTGRKPSAGWRGSVAEQVLDLDALGTQAATHFTGSAREAALAYPKNANVAAAVALAGLGFDATEVVLIADPAAQHNGHEIHACGDFGEMQFSISGATLPGAPRTSALAAMSVVRRIADLNATVRF